MHKQIRVRGINGAGQRQERTCDITQRRTDADSDTKKQTNTATENVSYLTEDRSRPQCKYSQRLTNESGGWRLKRALIRHHGEARSCSWYYVRAGETMSGSSSYTSPLQKTYVLRRCNLLLNHGRSLKNVFVVPLLWISTFEIHCKS